MQDHLKSLKEILQYRLCLIVFDFAVIQVKVSATTVLVRAELFTTIELTPIRTQLCFRKTASSRSKKISLKYFISRNLPVKKKTKRIQVGTSNNKE